MTTSEAVKIEEYQEGGLADAKISEEDINYLENYFLNKKPQPFTIFRDLKKDLKIKNTSYAGIIQLEETRIHFSTKVETNLFYMLSFLKSEKKFIYDSNKIIEIKEGGNFFDVLGRLFFNELEELLNQGLLKKYVEKEENLSYLKGKLLFNEQIKQNLLLKPKFCCRYHDLTCDNVENQIILRALNLLIPMIRFNDDLKYDLLKRERDLKEEVSLNLAISSRDCNMVSFDRLNQHYKPIIDFSKLIFAEHFIRSVHKGKSKGFNFIVNMWQVYEDFLTEMIKDVVRDDPVFSDYTVVSQLSFDTLVKEKRIITKPDIIIKAKGTDEYPLIIDAKYKKHEANSDYYQMIAYSLAIKKSKKCCLIYPKTDKSENGEFTVVRDVLDENSKTIKFYTRTISLFEVENEDFKTFVKRIQEDEIKPILRDLLDL